MTEEDVLEGRVLEWATSTARFLKEAGWKGEELDININEELDEDGLHTIQFVWDSEIEEEVEQDD